MTRSIVKLPANVRNTSRSTSTSCCSSRTSTTTSTCRADRHGGIHAVAEFIDSGDRFAPDLSLYGDVPLHAQSHGESFLALAANRFGADGVYLLDEPEAALSVTGALALLAVVARAAKSGAQFVIATHSPILLAAPGARIYELDEDGINITDYDDLQAVRLTRGFLDAPDRYLRQIMPDSEADDG